MQLFTSIVDIQAHLCLFAFNSASNSWNEANFEDVVTSQRMYASFQGFYKV